VRRLTRRVIPLPLAAGSSASARPSPSDRPTLADAPLESELLEALPVASSLAELRFPEGPAADGGDGSSVALAADGGGTNGASPGGETDVASAATNADENEPTEPTEPNASQQAGQSSSQRGAAEELSGPPAAPSESRDALPPPLAAAAVSSEGSSSSGTDEPLPESSVGSRGASAVGEGLEDEPQTNPHIKVPELAQLRASEPGALWKSGSGASQLPPPIGSGVPKPLPHGLESPVPRAAGDGASVPTVPAIPKNVAPAGIAERVRPDSDAPTRPRIELSEEMALAAGRVTSLDVPRIHRDPVILENEAYVPGRGSKVPPPGEPRMISSLTGRRSAVPPVGDDDEVQRPSVVVTRAKIISDRPPRPDQLPLDIGKLPDSPLPAEALDPLAASERSDSTPHVPAATVPTMRPSRRPSGSADGDEFETLDIDSVVESASPREGTAATEQDNIPSKAPPPPPQLKRVPTGVHVAAAAAAAAAPPPPKAAPPPPPRAAVPALQAAPALQGPPALVAATALPTTPVSPVTAPMRKPGRGPRRRQWYETLFSDEYLRTVVRPSGAQISRQVDFMQASLGVAKGSAVLDVGCGLGQHALEFARRGCLVVALDLALPMITRAAEDAQQEGLRINFLHKDIRDIGFEGTFDAVVCVGTTFGFFDDEQNREVLGRLANALKPGGRLLLEVVNRDHVLTSQPNLQWFEGDGCVVMEESDFNYYSSRISVKRTMMREDGRQTESEYSIRLYALHELGQMMQQVGFRVKEVSGQQATRGVFFGAHSNRIILLAERRVQGPQRANGHASDPPPEE
jgi:SAM-dependent methyltransferase